MTGQLQKVRELQNRSYIIYSYHFDDFRLVGTDFFCTVNNGILLWYKHQQGYYSGVPTTFKYVFENSPEEIRQHMIWDLDLLS